MRFEMDGRLYKRGIEDINHVQQKQGRRLLVVRPKIKTNRGKLWLRQMCGNKKKKFFTSNGFYAGANEYFIVRKNNTHAIKCDCFYFDITVFAGSFKDCLKEKDRIIAENLRYDLNI